MIGRHSCQSSPGEARDLENASCALSVFGKRQNPSRRSAGVLASYVRLGKVILQPIVPITLIIYGVAFMWTIGINASSAILLVTPAAEGGYGVSPKVLGFFYFIPITAVIIGEIFGHFFNDFIVRSYTRRHQMRFVPEVRLWTTYLGASLMIPGLILVGQTLHHHLHWTGMVFGWGMHVVGVMLMSVAIAAYILDCFPSAAGEVSAWFNFIRPFLGFAVPYFQRSWGVKEGYDVSFGIQAVITVVATGLIVVIHLYGARIRKWSNLGPFQHA